MFPYSRHPGSIVFLDDDNDFLGTIRELMRDQWNIRTFEGPTSFIEHMTAKIAVTRDMEAYLLSAMERYRKHGQAAAEVLRYWNSFPERFAIPKLVVLDYNMPVMNGLQAMERCVGWNGQKLLLTGTADEEAVSNAFNTKAIDYYMPKQKAKLFKELAEVLKRMMAGDSMDSSSQWTPWYMSMSAEQNLILKTPAVVQGLLEAVGPKFEHVTIGNPFGVMALGHAGGVKWIQLETASTLDDAADIAVAAGLGANEAMAIRSGRMLSNARINGALNLGKPVELAPTQLQFRTVANEAVYGTAFDIAPASAPSADMCFAAWHSRQISN